ncbi:MAG: hypothetical protein HY581_07740 [Nitrospirae bacterium]|nr:hypothetical protein [Nitrospirota bacterium]
MLYLQFHFSRYIVTLSCLLLLLLSPAFQSFAQQSGGQASTAIRTAISMNNRLLANPPLPLLYLRKGDYKITFQPAYFTGKVDGTDGEGLPVKGDFDGWGGAVNMSYAFADQWAVYGLVLGSTLSGDFTQVDTSSGITPFKEFRMSGADASSVTLGGGLSYQFFGETPGGFTLPVFLGPTLTIRNTESRIVETGFPVGGGPFGVAADYDLKSKGVTPGLFAGIHAGIPLGDYFLLNPFATFYYSFQRTMSGEVGAVRVDDGNPQNSLNSFRRGLRVEAAANGANVGANLVYRPWGLSVNITAPFITKDWSGGRFGQAVHSTLITISIPFGKYEK